ALVDLMNFVFQAEFAENDAASAESIRLNYIGAGFEVGGVNVLNNVRTAQDQNFRAVLFAPEIIERRVALLNLSAHGAVIDEDALPNCLEVGFHSCEVETPSRICRAGLGFPLASSL